MIKVKFIFFLSFFACTVLSQESGFDFGNPTVTSNIKTQCQNSGQDHVANDNTYFGEPVSCELGAHEEIIIACSLGCLPQNRKIISEVAAKLNYRVRFIALNRKDTLAETLKLEEQENFVNADGYLMEGGGDVLPSLYQDLLSEKDKLTEEDLGLINKGMKSADRLRWQEKDLFEKGFLRQYFTQKNFEERPLIGICRGMQLLGVVSGLPLYSDLDSKIQVPNLKKIIHEIQVSGDECLLKRVMKEKSFSAYENHHQGIHYNHYKENREKYPDIIVSATSHNDKILESIEFKSRKNVLGMQYHPEWSSAEIHDKIFGWFLNKACEAKKASVN